MSQPRIVVVHPFLLSLYSVLGFYTQNITEMRLIALLPIAVAVGLGSSLLFGFAWLLLRDSIKAGLLTTAAILVILFYGLIFGSLSELFDYKLRHRYVLSSLVALPACFLFFLTRLRCEGIPT